jgi:paraquat-inducible protein A
MTEVVAIDLRWTWRACGDCGLLQRLPQLREREAAVCGRCEAVLHRASKHSLLLSGIDAIAAAIFFALALVLPLGRLRVLGRTEVASVFSGPRELAKDGLALLAALVVATVVVVPALKLAVTLTVLLGTCMAQPPRWVAWLFGWLDRLAPWSMVEVFLLGGVVAYSRLQAMATVEVGLAALALGGTMLALVATDATLDAEEVWRALGGRRTYASAPARPAPAGLIACGACHHVAQGEDGDRCPRCRHLLASRKGHPRGAWALLLAAAFLYVPANLLPVMTVRRMGSGSPTTILHGVVELAQAHLWPLALLVLLASIVIPVFKLLSLTGLMVMTQRRSPRWLKGRTRLFRFVRFVGRWSMIDIFMLSVLVGLVRFGTIASILPGMGAMAFCAVVLLTMAVTEIFDPRLMWDAAGRGEMAFESPDTPAGKELDLAGA